VLGKFNFGVYQSVMPTLYQSQSERLSVTYNIPNHKFVQGQCKVAVQGPTHRLHVDHSKFCCSQRGLKIYINVCNILCESRFCEWLSTVRSWGSSVNIVSGYGLDDQATEVWSLAEARDFSSNLCVQTDSGAHPASCTMGTGGPFPGDKARPGRDADRSLI